MIVNKLKKAYVDFKLKRLRKSVVNGVQDYIDSKLAATTWKV